ncbi:MAG: hypothetical protein WBM83_03810 [Flavobacteriaceae bacterium]
MKKSLVLPLLFVFLLAVTATRSQQIIVANNDLEMANAPITEEDGPILLKFEPNFTDLNEQRMAEISHTRAILDTLDISDRKRRQLLKELYKNGISQKLSKALWVETTFEDIED